MKLKAENSLYLFNGHCFLEFIDLDKFKSEINSRFKIPEEIKNLDLAPFYNFLIEHLPNRQKEIGLIFFENILYSHLKNVFVDKISAHPNLSVEFFKQKVKNLITDINHKEVVPSNYHRLMSENGFYLMDVLNITLPNTTFIAGYDFTENNGLVTNARFLFVNVVPRSNQGTAYFLAGIEIDFLNNHVLTMVKNVAGIKKADDETNTTVHQIHQNVIKKVLNNLGISLSMPVVKDDRAGMYKFCKQLDDNLLSDIRQEINLRTENAVKDSVKNFNSVLFNGTEKLNDSDKGDLSKKIHSLLLSYYIDYKIKPIDLVRKAKSNKLVGYPTRIKFTSSKSSRSSTQSQNSKHPVSATDMFHSLYFNFEQALGLDNWSISWFTDHIFINDKDIDVIQTTIYSTSKQFRIVFLANRPLNKEIIKYVVGTINSYR